MSVGNLKDSGNQGNNFPWQLKMLLGLDCSCTQLQTANSILQDIDDNTDQLEFLLSSILVTLQSSTEYEAKFVVDTCNGDTVYLEVRVWNPDDSTWGPITYYLPGSSTPVVPPGASTPGCLQYTDPSGVLGMILAELQLQTPILTDIETNTGDTVTELQSLLALYTAGQSACANSLSVTLCTEQGTTLSGILTELQGTLDVNVTNPSISVTQGTNPWIIGDGGGSITVDGSVSVTGSVEITNDIGNAIPVTVGNVVNVNLDAADDQVGIYGYVNGASGSPVPLNVNATGQVAIQDGGNSITVDGTVAATQSGTWNIAAVTGPVALPTGAATEATLSALNSQFTAVTRTPSLIRTGGAGTIAGARSISVYNAGAAAGSILGVAGNILPGEIFNFDAGGENDTLAAFAYNGAGTTLVITTIV